MVPFFDFAIGLRMFDSGQDMLNLIFHQELVESTLRFPILVCLVGKELCAMIGDYLSDHPNLAIVFKRLSHQVDAGFGSCSGKFSARKNESGAIIENHADLFAIEPTGMPVKMNGSEAMFSFVSDPWLPTFLLFFILIG